MPLSLSTHRAVVVSAPDGAVDERARFSSASVSGTEACLTPCSMVACLNFISFTQKGSLYINFKTHKTRFSGRERSNLYPVHRLLQRVTSTFDTSPKEWTDGGNVLVIFRGGNPDICCRYKSLSSLNYELHCSSATAAHYDELASEPSGDRTKCALIGDFDALSKV